MEPRGKESRAHLGEQIGRWCAGVWEVDWDQASERKRFWIVITGIIATLVAAAGLVWLLIALLNVRT